VIPFTAVAEGWRAFFHAPEPPHTIALFRIVFGVVLIVNVVSYARDARLWAGPEGLVSHDEFLRLYGRSRFTLFTWLPPTERTVWLVIGAHLAAAVSLTVGWLTPWSAGVAFVTLASLQHRNPLVGYGGDDALRIMTFLLIFSRAGDVASIDAWWAGPRVRAADASPWCTRLMQLQVSIVYLQAFLSKFAGETWRQGSAVYYAVEVPKFRRYRLPRWARTLTGARLLTWTTLAVELALGSIVWIRECRLPVVLAGLAMHAGMEVFMNLHLFGAVMAACLLLFLDPAAARWGLEWLRVV
jgi:hypothetical protein